MPLATDTAAWLTAIGTVGAVAAALFLQLLLPFVLRPKLEIAQFDLGSESGDRSLVTAADRPPDKQEYASLWFRLRVTNNGRGTAARNAQVTVIEARPMHETEPGTVIPTRPLKWADLPKSRLDIPAGVTRHVDLVSMRLKPGAATNGRLRLELWPRDKNDLRHWLESGRYELRLAVTADGARPRVYRLALDFKLDAHQDATELRDANFNPIAELRS